MIPSMLKSLGRSIFTFFVRPAPTSVALMAGPRPGLAANDDQSQMLRRAMQAATAAEETRDDGGSETVQTFEPISIDDTDDSAAAQAAVFAPVKPVAIAPAANDAATHDTVEEPAFETAASQPIALADWVEVEIDEHAAAEADLALEALEACAHVVSEEVIETAPFEDPVLDVPVEEERLGLEAEPMLEAEIAVEAVPIVEVEAVAEAEPVEAAPEVEMPVEAVALAPEAAVDEVVSQEVDEPDDKVAAAVEDVAEKKPRKKRAPAKRKAAAKPRKSKAADALEPVPADDVWVSDAVAWSLSGEWTDGAHVEPESSDCPRRLEELREAAAEGRLTIWGRTGDAGTWQPIEASYWKSGTVAPSSLAEGRENVVAEPKTKGKTKAARKYSALKVSRAQVEELWHPDAMH